MSFLPLKSDHFVPANLRFGFVGQEGKPGSKLVKGCLSGFKGKPDFREPKPGQIQDSRHYRSKRIDDRPKAGEEYEPIIKITTKSQRYM